MAQRQMLIPQQAMIKAQKLQEQGQLSEAEAIYRSILEERPNFHPAYYCLGLIAHGVGKQVRATDLIAKAIELDATISIYHRDIGEMYRRLDRFEEALASGKMATDLAPQDPEAHYNLGLALTHQSRHREAADCYQRAVSIDHKHGLALNNLGTALEALGDKVAAESAYAKAVKINPRHAEAQNNLGALLSEQGKLDEARHCFKVAIDVQPMFVDPHYNLSSLKTYTADDPHLATLESLAKQLSNFPLVTQSRFHFALGKAREDTGQYDRAFSAYADGNRLQHQLFPYNEASADEALAKITARFDRVFFKEHQACGSADYAPVFIVGMPRSGTTLIEQILASHSAVYGAGELADLNEVILSGHSLAAPGLTLETSFTDWIHNLSDSDWQTLGNRYGARVKSNAPDATYITDKMPANFFYIGMIHLMLPRAKIIHVVRDPMDSCLSCFARLFNNNSMNFTYDQSTLGRYYIRYSQLMDHWRKVLPENAILDVHYEDIITDTEKQTRRLLDYLALPWEDSCLAFYENKRRVQTASIAQVRRPIYQTSLGRWKRFSSHVDTLLNIVRVNKEERQRAPESTMLSPEPIAPIVQHRTETISIEQAMELATQHQGEGKLEQSESILREIIKAQPNHAYALNLLGVIAHQSGQTERALQLIGQAIAHDNSQALFHANRGEMCRLLGRLDDAVLHAEKAVELSPDMASAYSNLGIAHYDLHNYDAAKLYQQKALEITPDFAAALNNMGSIFREGKQVDDAIACYQKAIAADPTYLEPLNNLGAVLIEEEQPEAAVNPLNRAVEINSQYSEAHCNLGLAYNAMEQYEKAFSCLNTALSLRPDYPEACLGIARICQEKENFKEAERLALRALAVRPDKAESHSVLGSIYTEMGFPDRAEKYFDKAVELDPNLVSAHVGKGTLLMHNGQLTTAEIYFQKAIQLNPKKLAARFSLTQVKNVCEGDENMAALKVQVEGISEMSESRALCLHFALGKCHDDMGDYHRAFSHFLEGCRLKRNKIDYDSMKTDKVFDQVMEIFDAETIESLVGNGNLSELPIFILGMPRSGTTLTEQIIASHPDVHGAGELPDMQAITHRSTFGLTSETTQTMFPNNLRDLTTEQLVSMAADYIAGLSARSPDSLRITDKMPTNFFFIGLIHLMLPNAKIIHVKRNPADTCVSCFSRLFNRNQYQSYKLSELGRYYSQYAKLMSHWRSVLPNNAFLEVQYEDLVSDNETQARRLISFCGLEWDDGCLEFYKNKRIVKTASVTQVRQPIYTSSVNRWQRYEEFLSPLFNALGELSPKKSRSRY